MRLTQSAAVAAAAVAVVGVVAAASSAGGDPAVSNPASNMHIASKLDGDRGDVSAASELEKLSKAELIARLRELEGRAPPPAQQEQLWPELMKTPFMMWNGWLPTTKGLIPGMANNESLYYAAADRLVSSGLRDAGYDTIAVTCNGWRRNAHTGNLEVDPVTWPRGYKAFIDYLHARELKICAYSDTGPTNCCGELGILGHEEQVLPQPHPGAKHVHAFSA